MSHRCKKLCSLLLLAMTAGCANVHYEHGKADLNNKELVFGKIILNRGGETDTISTFGTPVNISDLESLQEPLMITESFEKDGRFYWALSSGLKQLSIALHGPSNDIISLAFSVPDAPGAYYFGDLTLSGKKHFSTLGGANIKDVSASFADNFDTEKAELLRRNPGLAADQIKQLHVFDISKSAERAAFFRQILNDSPSCCDTMAAFKFIKLGYNDPETYGITSNRGSYDFPTGKSYFRAFALPEYSAPYSIHLRSLTMVGSIPGRFRIFAPGAMLLDSQFNVLQTMEPNFMHATRASIMPPRTASLEGNISISGNNAKAKYLVIYTTDQLLSHPLSTTIPGAFIVPGGALPSGIPRIAYMEPWLTGKIEITLRPDQ